MCTWWIKWILYNVQIGKLSSKSRPAAYGRSGWKSVIDHFPDPSGHLWPAAMANHECLKGWFEVNHLEINCFQYHHILPYIITMYYHMFNITIYYHRHKYMSDSVRFSRRNHLTLRTLRVCHHPLRHMVSLRIMILGSFPRMGRQNLPGLWYSVTGHWSLVHSSLFTLILNHPIKIWNGSLIDSRKFCIQVWTLPYVQNTPKHIMNMYIYIYIYNYIYLCVRVLYTVWCI